MTLNTLRSFLPLRASKGKPLHLDGEALVRDLDVEQKASKDAVDGKPGFDATELSPTEQEILREGGERQRLACEATGEALNTLTDERIELTDQLQPRRLEAIIEEAETQIARSEARFKPALTEAWNQEQRAERDRKAFKYRAGLTREPHYPTTHRVLYAALGGTIVSEGAINAWAFSEASAFGWLGGLQAAMVLAAVNVLVAFVFGNLLRGFNHRRWARKTAAAFAGAAYLAFLAVYTLMVGHYRDALLANPDSATAEAVLRLLHTPLGIFDFNTLLLMLASVGFSVAAAVAGYRSSDPYPGYEAVDRRYLPFRKKREALVNRFYGEIDAVLEQLPRQVGTRLFDARRARSRYQTSIRESERLIKRYAGIVSATTAAVHQAIGRYRQVNEAVRNTPVPRYFNDEIEPLGTANMGEQEQSLATARAFAATFPTLAMEFEQTADALRSVIQVLRRERLGAASEFVGRILAVAPEGEETPRPKPPRNGDGGAQGVDEKVVSFCPERYAIAWAATDGVSTTRQ